MEWNAGRDPLSILPEELWKIVLEHVENCEDLISAYRVCHLWNDLLGAIRTRWMFSEIFQHLYHYLPNEDILKSRLVCQGWNRAIEKFLERKDHILGKDHGYWATILERRPLQVNLTSKGIGTPVHQTLERFQSDFSGVLGRNKNPFLSRRVHLYIETLNVSSLLYFFEMFGSHIWSLEFWTFQPEIMISPLEVVQCIWKLLTFLPNLRKLHLFAKFWPFHYAAHDEQAKRIGLFLEQNPVPALPSLTNLKLNMDMGLIQEKLEVAYAPQLITYEHLRIKPIISETFPNLKQLSCECSNAVQYEVFKKLRCPTLREMIIYSSPYGHRAVFSVEVFQVAENFDKSLHKLKLVWNGLTGKFPTQLHLPHVRELTLEICRPETKAAVSLSFLKCLTNLRKLTIYFLLELHPDIIQFGTFSCKFEHAEPIKGKGGVWLNTLARDIGDQEKIYKNEIWQWIPQLDAITIGIIYQLYYETDSSLFKNRRFIVKTFKREELNTIHQFKLSAE